MTIPGVGPITAAAMMALAPAPQTFRRGRDFSAWLGLTPVQRSTGGKQKLGQITRAGERTLRRLLVIEASAVIKQALLKGAAPRLMARPDASAQAAHAGCGRPRQQERSHRLGAPGQGWDLSSSSAGSLTLSHRCETSRRRRTMEGMAQQSARRGRGKPGLTTVLSKHALGDLDPVRELPYGPAP